MNVPGAVHVSTSSARTVFASDFRTFSVYPEPFGYAQDRLRVSEVEGGEALHC
jgi:hypothetical protein